jgi:DNA-directed RNA polymerase subunit K/omega
MLYGRRLDQSLQHVDGSRYALVHAVAKRARQITLWLTADPAELRAEAAPPPAPGELTSRDPVALAEVEILDGEVKVRWDPEGLADEREPLEDIEADPLLLDGIGGDDDLDRLEDDSGTMTPALAQVLEGEAAVEDASEDEDDESDDGDDVAATGDSEEADLADDGDDLEEVSLDEVGETEDLDDEDEDL